MKHALVTGCAGFIGSSLTDQLLADGWKVTGIDNLDNFYARGTKENNLASAKANNNFSFVEGDICDTAVYTHIQGKPDVVIHLAARAGVRPSLQNPLEYIRVNITGTQTLLNWMNENGMKKLVFASSSSVYGNNAVIPFTESDNTDFPVSVYAYTKKSGELMCHTYHHLYDMDIICLRFFTVFGPRQRPDLAIHKFVKQALEGKSIPFFGDGSTSRDYTFISDIVAGINSAASYVMHNNKVYEIVNLGNNSPIKLSELVDVISEATGKEIIKDMQPMQPGDVLVTYANINKAQSLLGYSPKTTTKQGIEKFIAWYKLAKQGGAI